MRVAKVNGFNWAEYISPGDLVVDVGCNSGAYVGEFLKVGAKVIGFEPDASVAQECREKNPAADVRAVVIGEDVGTTMFYNCEHKTASSRYQGALDKRKCKEETLPLTTLDVVLAGRVPKGIKIDTQGGDGWVIVGAQETMAKMEKGAWLLFELWPSGLRAADFDIGRLIPLTSGWKTVAHGKGCKDTGKTLPDLVQMMRDFDGHRHTNVFLQKG